MSKWLTHLKKFYLDKKKTDKSYSYKNAMKDAAKTYNGNSETCTAKSTKMRKICSRKRRTLRKTRKARKTSK